MTTKTKRAQVGSPLVDTETHAEFSPSEAVSPPGTGGGYVELIADLIGDGGEARQIDIAARLGVAQPTVPKMLKRLAKEGLIAQRRPVGACS